jgi:hypothetical protein
MAVVPTPDRPSIRLVQVLRVYCDRLGRTSMGDLRAAIEAGRYSWFRGEFVAAIRGSLFTVDSWCKAVGTSPLTLTRYARGAATNTVCDQQRVVWAQLFPDEPFPHPVLCGDASEPLAACVRDRRFGEPVTAVTDRTRGQSAPRRRRTARPQRRPR